MSTTRYDSDDGEDVVCPLCCEPMDLSDQNFLPCPCGYRVCMWCWHRIKENYTNRCPACRSEYSDDPHAFAAVDKEMVIKNENNKKRRAKQKDADATSVAAAAIAAREYQHALHLRHQHQHQQHMQHLHREQVQLQQQQGGRGGGGAGTVGSVANRRDLANMRVVQRNLVYVTGLPVGLDSEEVLRRPENFGQYGKIYKIATSTSQSHVSAHITFAHKEDALACILATDGFWVEGRQLRSNFGTTKYCATYLRNVPCSNPDCLYLHELGEEEDRFTKEDIQQRSLIAPPIPAGTATTTGAGGPSGTGKRCSLPFLPPPVYESRDNGPSTGGSGSTIRGVPPQLQQAAAAGVAAAQRGATRGGKPSVQASAPRHSTSIGVAWGGAGATNGPSTQALMGDRSAVGVAINRQKRSVTAASPTASPHLQAHDAVRLQEEWPSLADTAAPPPALPPTPAVQPSGRAGRNRRKKEKQQQQLLQQQSLQHPHGEVVDSSPRGSPISPSQEPSSLTTAPAAAVPAPPPISQPPGLTPMMGAPGLRPQTQPAVDGLSGQEDLTKRDRALLHPDPVTRTVSIGQDRSTSMFSNPFFNTNGSRGGEDPSAPPTSAPAPPGFSGLPSPSIAAPRMSPMSSPSSPAVVMPSPHEAAPTPKATAAPAVRPSSLFKEQFRGNESVFNGGLYPSGIGSGLFSTEVRTEMAAVPDVYASDRSPSEVSASSAAVEIPSAIPCNRPSTTRMDAQGLYLPQPESGVDAAGGLPGLMECSAKIAGESVDSRYIGLPDDSAGGTFLGKTPASASSTASTLGGALCGGHFCGAFGSALFPVSAAQGGGNQGVIESANVEGGGADLSVDPFANSSGALAAMLGVTLPPVDSQSSLASKMRSGIGTSRSNPAGQNAVPQHAYFPPRGAFPYAEFSRDTGRGREMHRNGKEGARDISGGERGHGYRHDYVATAESSMHQEHRASRFSFAQDDNSGVTYSPAARSSTMGSDIHVTSGSMGSPPHPGQHHNHLHQHQHHQSHAHRPFGVGRPVSPAQPGEYGGVGGEGHFAPPSHHHHPSHHSHHHFQQQQQRLPQQQQPHQQQAPQQQYSIQNGMAFLQKVLPGVQLSYGDRHPPAGAGTGGQIQGQPQGQGASGALAGGGVGWGDNAAGQRVDPAQAFGSSLWTMAPASNAPRQPQGSRGGGYNAW